MDSRYALTGGTIDPSVSAGSFPAVMHSLRESDELELKSVLLETIGDGIIAHTIAGDVIYANRMAAEMLGYRPGALQSLEPWEWISPEDRDRVVALMSEMGEMSGSECGLVFDTFCHTAAGDAICVELHSRIVIANGHKLFVTVSRDITERSKAHATLQQLAFHDCLTGLANRTALEERVRLATDGASRIGGAVGVIYMDLDDFKPINDTHGHAIGDRVLRIIGERLRACVREGDTIARVGGDEFVALFPRLSSETDLIVKARELAGCISAPIAVDGDVVRVCVSVGLSTYEPGEPADEFIERADRAMYHAKLHGLPGWDEFEARLPRPLADSSM